MERELNRHHNGAVLIASEDTTFILPRIHEVECWQVEILADAKARVEIAGRTWGEILLQGLDAIQKVWIEPDDAVGSLTRIIHAGKQWFITSNAPLQFQRKD